MSSYHYRSGLLSRREVLRPHFSIRRDLARVEETTRSIECEQTMLASECERFKRLLTAIDRSSDAVSNKAILCEDVGHAIGGLEDLVKSTGALRNLLETVNDGGIAVKDELTVYELFREIENASVGRSILSDLSKGHEIDNPEEQLRKMIRTFDIQAKSFNIAIGAVSKEMECEQVWTKKEAVVINIRYHVEASVRRIFGIADEGYTLLL